MKHVLRSSGLIAALMMMFSVNASAYLDPSAVSSIIQVVFGVIIAAGASLAIFWKKIKMFFKRKKHKKRMDILEAANENTSMPE